MIGRLIIVAALVVAVAIAVFIFANPMGTNPGAPNVKFIAFTPDRFEIKVGETTQIGFNVQNMEARNITARLVTIIEPSGYQPYLSIDRPAIDLPPLLNKDSRTGQMFVSITATGAPAIEATYIVKGILYVDGTQTDVRQFELQVKQ